MRRNEAEAWDKHLSRTYGEKALFTLAETCEILGCSMPSVYGMMADGHLDVRRVMSSPRITRLSLIRYLACRRPAPVEPPAAARPEPHEQGRLL